MKQTELAVDLYMLKQALVTCYRNLALTTTFDPCLKDLEWSIEKIDEIMVKIGKDSLPKDEIHAPHQ